MKNIKYIFTILLIIVFSASWCSTASAVQTGVDFGDAESMVFNPEGGDLFANFKDVMPGDSLTQQIVIANTDSDTDKTIYLRTEVDKDSKELLNYMTISLYYSADVSKKGDAFSIVNASVEGNAKEWVCLGRLKPGQQKYITVELTVDKKMGNDQALKKGIITWYFATEDTAVEATETETAAVSVTNSADVTVTQNNIISESSSENSVTEKSVTEKATTGTTSDKDGEIDGDRWSNNEKLPFTGSNEKIIICALFSVIASCAAIGAVVYTDRKKKV